MAETEAEPAEIMAEVAADARRRLWPRVVGVLAAVFVLALLTLYSQREGLADRIIAGQLEKYDLPATYKIQRIGGRRQILTDVVVGDPGRPDFTAERLEVNLEPRLGIPTIGSVRLVRPRLYGSYRQGKLSFGSLDRVLFAPSDKPSQGLPDLQLTLEDGRARIDTDWGQVGVKAHGTGNLRDSFSGYLAATAPRMAFGDCRLEDTTLFGQLTTSAGRPAFKGPVRMASANCPNLAASQVRATLDGSAAADFKSAKGKVDLATGPLEAPGQRVRKVAGELDLQWRGSAASARYRLRGDGLSGQLAAGWLEMSGTARSRDNFAVLDSAGELDGAGISPGPAIDRSLAGLQESAAGTLGEPLLAQLRNGLRREGANSRVSASYTLRKSGQLTSLIVPTAQLTGTSGQGVLMLSRVQLGLGGARGLQLSGNVRTGGQGLPVLAGQVQRQGDGSIIARLSLAEYKARDASLAMPRLVVIQRPGGALGFAGTVLASGALPDGRVSGLELPIDGNYAAGRGLAVWRGCTPVRFRSLTYANLTLDGRALTLCPPGGSSILASNAGGTRFAAGLPTLALTGRLGSTPVSLRSGAVGFAWPGAFVARSVDVALGPAATASRFTISTLSGRLGKDIGGTFADTDVRLANVPLDVLDSAGTWRFAAGRLTLSDAAFRLEDREAEDKFRPLLARGGELTLFDNRIAATATLREPASDRLVTNVRIAHNLATSVGSADLEVPGITFDGQVQPDTLTYLALGVIANARGEVRGSGRIDWNRSGVTSTGRFTTDDLDFAAAFGPVQDLSGTIVFTDLLGLVTAPNQQLKIGTMNPGIEVYDGVLDFALVEGQRVQVNGARWPFMNGELLLLPTTLDFRKDVARRFTLRVIGLDAGRFVQQLNLGNISATGIFDGDLPLIFDERGGRIENGLLVSRPPGGNLSYIGVLTYKNMGAMANFAFEALRSLDFKKMEIGLEGQLEGDIFTKVRTDAVTQGAGAKKNFITREFGKLPIQFNVNIRAPFKRLLNSFRSLYDPALVRDPRELGLVDAQGRPVANPQIPQPVPPDIQPPVSRKSP